MRPIKVLLKQEEEQKTMMAYQVYLLQARTQKSLRVTFEKALVDYGLSLQQWMLLSTVRDSGRQELTMSAIAAITNMPLSQTTVVSQSLLEKKLVKQKVGKSDFRNRRLVCTAAGKRAIDKCNKAMEETLISWRREALDENQFQALIRMLQKLGK